MNIKKSRILPLAAKLKSLIRIPRNPYHKKRGQFSYKLISKRQLNTTRSPRLNVFFVSKFCWRAIGNSIAGKKLFYKFILRVMSTGNFAKIWQRLDWLCTAVGSESCNFTIKALWLVLCPDITLFSPSCNSTLKSQWNRGGTARKITTGLRRVGIALHWNRRFICSERPPERLNCAFTLYD